MPASTCLLVEPFGTKVSYYAELILNAGCFELMVAHGDDEARKYVSEYSWLSTLIIDTAISGFAELARFVRRRSPTAKIILVGDTGATTVPEANAIISRQNRDALLAALRPKDNDGTAPSRA
jgi:hypothetical protein